MWEELDTHGDGMIRVTQLTTLLAAVDPPMGVKGLSNTAIRVQAIVQSLDIPLRNQHIHFLVRLSDPWDEQRSSRVHQPGRCCQQQWLHVRSSGTRCWVADCLST